MSTAWHKSRPWMFRYAVALAVCVVALIVPGAWVTSEIQPVPGSSASPVNGSTPTEALLEQSHKAAAVAVGFLTLGFAVWLQRAEKRAWLRRLGWAALAVVMVEGWSGMQSIRQTLPRAAGFFHALLAQVLLSMVVAIAVGVSGGSERDELVEDSGRPSLRSLAVVMPLLTLLQAALGAAYRHGVMGVLSHILNAMIVAIVVLVVCMLVIRQFPGHPSLRPAALALAIVTGVQVSLGFATFIVLLIGSGGTAALVILSVGHAATGALTLAASVMLAIQIWRHVRVSNRQT